MEEYSYTSTHPLGHNRPVNAITLAFSTLYESWNAQFLKTAPKE
jgi:hypothetical protein